MTPPDELSCQEVVELVTDCLEGALPAAERARFEQHLGGCAGCLAYLDQVRRTIQVVGTLRDEDVDPAVLDALVGSFRGWRR
jgi:hypothetical protein